MKPLIVLLVTAGLSATMALPVAVAQSRTVETYSGDMFLPRVETHVWPNVEGVDAVVLRADEWVGPQPDLDLCFMDKHGFEIGCWDNGSAVKSGFVPQGTKSYEIHMPTGLDVSYRLVLIDQID